MDRERPAFISGDCHQLKIRARSDVGQRPKMLEMMRIVAQERIAGLSHAIKDSEEFEVSDPSRRVQDDQRPMLTVDTKRRREQVVAGPEKAGKFVPLTRSRKMR